MMNKQFYMYIGSAGAGKSTHAKSLTTDDHIHESDKFPGLYRNGKILFYLLKQSHAYCLKGVRDDMISGERVIVQSNTNLDPEHWLPYLQLCREYCYDVNIMFPEENSLLFYKFNRRGTEIDAIKLSRSGDEKFIPGHVIDGMVQKLNNVRSKYEKYKNIKDPNVWINFLE